jgi:hypothetical protein
VDRFWNVTASSSTEYEKRALGGSTLGPHDTAKMATIAITLAKRIVFFIVVKRFNK